MVGIAKASFQVGVRGAEKYHGVFLEILLVEFRTGFELAAITLAQVR